MILKVRNDGSVIEFPQSVVTQGSKNAQKLQVVAPFSKEVTAEVYYRLPNGANLGPYMMTAYNFGESNSNSLWSTRLEYGETEFAGTVNFTIVFRNNLGETEEVLATVNSTFTVNKGNYPNIDITPPETDAWESIITNLNQVENNKYNFIDYNNIPDGISYRETGYKDDGIYYDYNNSGEEGSLVVRTAKIDDLYYQYEILYAIDDSIFEGKLEIKTRVYSYEYVFGGLMERAMTDWQPIQFDIENITDLQTLLDSLQTQLDSLEISDISSLQSLLNNLQSQINDLDLGTDIAEHNNDPTSHPDKMQESEYVDGTGKLKLDKLPDITKQPTLVFSTTTEFNNYDTANTIAGTKAFDTEANSAYVWDGTQWLLTSDADWANINLDWSNITNAPTNAASDSLINKLVYDKDEADNLINDKASAEDLENLSQSLTSLIGTTVNRYFTSDTIDLFGNTYNLSKTADPNLAEAEFTQTVSATDESTADLVSEFIADEATTSEITLPQQSTYVSIRAKKGNTQRNIKLFAEFYDVDDTGVETLKGTSQSVDLKTENENHYLFLPIDAYTVPVGHRSLIKFKSYYTGNGTTSDSTITILGDTKSRWTYSLTVADLGILSASDISYNSGTVKTELDDNSKPKEDTTILAGDWDTNNQYVINKFDKPNGDKYDVYQIIPHDYQLYSDMEILVIAEDTDTITIETKAPDNIADITLSIKGVI